MDLSYEDFLKLLDLIPSELASVLYELYKKVKDETNEGNN